MDATAVVEILGGLGMFLLGIHHLTEGLKGLAGDSLRRTLQKFVSGRFSAVVSGVFFTAAIQSSTAATLTVIGFVSAGLITFPYGVADRMPLLGRPENPACITYPHLEHFPAAGEIVIFDRSWYNRAGVE
jgi:predicted PurR-regulated permease PerM